MWVSRALGDKFESDNRIESQPYFSHILEQYIQLLSHHEKVYNTNFRSSISVEAGGIFRGRSNDLLFSWKFGGFPRSIRSSKA